jgi:SAM-dependent methyltransferase
MKFRKKKCVCCGSTLFNKSGTYRLEAKNISYPLVKCNKCGHVFAHPTPKKKDIEKYYKSDDFWKEYGLSKTVYEMNWDEIMGVNSTMWENNYRAREQLDFIKRKCKSKKNNRIIEFGSGFAPFLYNCRKNGFRMLFALEPSSEICDYLAKKNIKTYSMLMEEFVNKKKLPEFDLMHISHTLEHIKEPDRVLKKLRKNLSRQGVLFIEVPYRDNLRPFHQGMHLQFFNRDSISRLLERCGYKVLFVEAQELNIFEKIFIRLLYFVYGKLLVKKGGTTGKNKIIEFLHRVFWQRFKKITNTKINISLSSQDLIVLAKRG